MRLNVMPWRGYTYSQGLGSLGASCSEGKGKLTDSLAGAIGNENLFKGRGIGSCSNEDNVGVNLGRLSTFRGRARWRTTSRQLCLRRTDVDVISSADNSDTAIYAEECAGTRVVTGRDDVGDTQ